VPPAAQPLTAPGSHVEHRSRSARVVVDDLFKRPWRRVDNETIAEHREVPAAKGDLTGIPE
jgi:hypothetical protein